MLKKRSWLLITGLLLVLSYAQAIPAASSLDLAVMKVVAAHRVHPTDTKKLHIQIKNLSGLGGSGTLTVTKTSDLGTATIFTGPFTIPSDSETLLLQLDYTFEATDIPRASFRACISVEGDLDASNNCNSDISLVIPP